MVPGLQSLDYAEQFVIVDFVVPLGYVKRVRNIATRMPVATGVLLVENTTCGPLGGIGFDNEWFLVVGHQEHWGFLELCFQVFEQLLTVIGPVPCQIPFC
jgi:hypothetical protein